MNFFLTSPTAGEKRAEVEILVDGGPLCVGPVWNWEERRRVRDLYFVYLKRIGRRFGPFYAGIELAARDMRKALKAFPAGFWAQPIEWYARQKAFHQWIEKNMGKADGLVGGVWARE